MIALPLFQTLAKQSLPLSQIMALVVIVLGASVSIFFQIFVREDQNIRPPTQKWYWWLTNSQFYLVRCHL